MYRILCILTSEYLHIRAEVEAFDELYDAVYLPEEFISNSQEYSKSYKPLEFLNEHHAKRALSKITDSVCINGEWITVRSNILLFEVVKC